MNTVDSLILDNLELAQHAASIFDNPELAHGFLQTVIVRDANQTLEAHGSILDVDDYQQIAAVKLVEKTVDYDENRASFERFMLPFMLQAIRRSIESSTPHRHIPEPSIRDDDPFSFTQLAIGVGIDSDEERFYEENGWPLESTNSAEDDMGEPPIIDPSELDRIMSDLTEVQRDVIVKVFYDGLSLKEIAGLYGVTPQAISSRYNKALVRMKKTAERKNIVPELT